MNMGITNIIIACVAAVLIIYLIKQFLKLQRIKEMEKRTEQYESLLQEARQSRMKHISAHEQKETYQHRMGLQATEMAVDKTNLRRFRADMQKNLKELRVEQAQELKTQFELKVLEQSKLKYEAKWKIFNGMKVKYNDSLRVLNQMKSEFEPSARQEETAFRQWNRDKERVMKLYHELQGQMKLTNPHQFLGRDS